MVSNAKRMRYVSEDECTSSDDTYEDCEYPQSGRKSQNSDRKVKSKGKWLSKNAIMARENRLKKKLYLTNLEKQVDNLKTENSNFSKLIESQSMLITDLKKEVKYLKSVIANSTDISKLIRNIHQNTGMSVSTSLDQSLSVYVSKPKQAIAKKTAHPWEDKYPSYPTPESDLMSDDFNVLNDLELNEFLGDNLLDNLGESESDNQHLIEHNYTSNDGDDVGVCLHVSKHRVSLEFCSTCSEKASDAWND